MGYAGGAKKLRRKIKRERYYSRHPEKMGKAKRERGFA